MWRFPMERMSVIFLFSWFVNGLGLHGYDRCLTFVPRLQCGGSGNRIDWGKGVM